MRILRPQVTINGGVAQWSVGLEPPDLARAAGAFLALCDADIKARKLPPLYASGVRYRRESAGAERWQLPHQTLALGYGDCEDLAGWRAAELRALGERCTLVFRKSGPRLWHAVVRRANGVIEDPSAALGMRGAA